MYDYEIDADKTVRIYATEQLDLEARPTKRLFLEQYGFASKAKATEFAKAEVAMWTNTMEEARRYEEKNIQAKEEVASPETEQVV